MTNEQFIREADYAAAMSAARSMRARGIIDEQDYHKIDTMLRGKYRPIFGDLSLEIDLL